MGLNEEKYPGRFLQLEPDFSEVISRYLYLSLPQNFGEVISLPAQAINCDFQANNFRSAFVQSVDEKTREDLIYKQQRNIAIPL